MGRKKKEVKELIAYKPETAPANLVKLDLGCGTRKVAPEWTGVDIIKFEGTVNIQFNLAERVYERDGKFDKEPTPPFKFDGEEVQYAKWPWADNSVDEVHCSHFIEHLKAPQRVHFVNELYRVLKPNANATIIAPNWSSRRAYGDLTHQWPPVADFWFFYLDKNWRASQAPHDDFYTCDFGIRWGYALSDSPILKLKFRNDEYKEWAQNHLVNAAEDVQAIFTKRV